MSTWQLGAFEHLDRLIARVDLPDHGSDVPPYILEVLSVKLARIDRSKIRPEELHAIVRGAFRAIGDAGFAQDDDPIVQHLIQLDDVLPPDS